MNASADSSTTPSAAGEGQGKSDEDDDDKDDSDDVNAAKRGGGGDVVGCESRRQASSRRWLELPWSVLVALLSFRAHVDAFVSSGNARAFIRFFQSFSRDE